MDRISGLPDDLLIKILLFVPTKVAVSTSILSKRWEFVWMWLPKLEYHDYKDITNSTNRLKSLCLRYRDFIDKNLPLHKAPIIESLCLKLCCPSSYQPEDIKRWVGIAVSRCVRELLIGLFSNKGKPYLVLPSSLYICKSLATLKLTGTDVLVDVPRNGCLPSLKTLQLLRVTYLNESSLRLLLSYLEDLFIERYGDDNVRKLSVIVPSLQKLTLCIAGNCSSDRYFINVPSLKYFKVEDYRDGYSYLIKHMPKLEEADIIVEQDPEQFIELFTSVKRLSLKGIFYNYEEPMYRAGIVFDQLEHLKLCIGDGYWSKLLVRLLNDSPKLRVLNLSVDHLGFWKYEHIDWNIEEILIPKCLLKTLETFEFAGYEGRPEERNFLRFFYKNARCLKSTPILH